MTAPKASATPAPPATSPQQAEATGVETLTVEFDGEAFVIERARFNSLEYLDAVYMAISQDSDIWMMGAFRVLLGPTDAQRLFKGRDRDAVKGFFDAVGEAAGTGNQ